MSKKPRVLVLTGDGINCEQETAQAFSLAGFEAEVWHLNDVIAKNTPEFLGHYAALALPGGFSFGDDLTSGKVLALKIRHQLGWDLARYAESGGLVIGICNGFQALIRLGVFGRDVSITHNSHGKFLDTWIRLQVAPASGSKASPWLVGLETLDLPIRHGEGRIVIGSERRAETLPKMEKQDMLRLRYETDPNGSEMRLAGLTDPTGRILGLMPHPEAFVRRTAHSEWTLDPARASESGDGLAIFKNAYQAVQKGT